MTYLATPVNWNLGTAAIILHLRSSRRIGAIESTSSMLFYQTIDGIVLAGVVLIGVSLLPESPEIASLRRIAVGFECFQVAMLAVLMASVPDWRPLDQPTRLLTRRLQLRDTPASISVSTSRPRAGKPSAGTAADPPPPKPTTGPGVRTTSE